MDNENVKTEVTADNTAEAGKTTAAAGLGKFQSVDALLEAYRSLEAEFTRRSQRLRELEEGNKAQNMSAQGAPSREVEEGELLNKVLENESLKRAVIENYLSGIAENKSLPLISGGVGSAAPRYAPKSVKEAGALAEKFLKNGD